MRHAEHIREVFLRHLTETPCLDRIEYVETQMNGSGPTYTGWVRVLVNDVG